jgi:hypothetical protein
MDIMALNRDCNVCINACKSEANNGKHFVPV